MKRLILTAAAVAAALALSLSGCASDDTSGETSGGASVGSNASDDVDPGTKIVKYAECLQKAGFAATVDANGDLKMPGNYDRAQRTAAEAACRSVAPPGMLAKPSAEELDRAVKMAQCLRGQGVNVKDPTEDHPAPELVGDKPDNLKELTEACAKKVGGGAGTGGNRK